MKATIALVIALLLTIQYSKARDAKKVLSHIPKTGKNIAAFIPNGYDTIATAMGDLDKDGKEDIVLVLHDKKEDTADLNSDENEGGRPLIVLLKTSDGWIVATKSEHAILCKSCGGVYGDPFVGIEISKGVLTIDHYGGSNWRWSRSSKFRYQDSDFYLVGETKDSYSLFGGKNCDDIGSANRDFEDINFVTGQRERQKTSEDCKVLLDKKDKIAKKPLIKLADYK